MRSALILATTVILVQFNLHVNTSNLNLLKFSMETVRSFQTETNSGPLFPPKILDIDEDGGVHSERQIYRPSFPGQKMLLNCQDELINTL